MNLRKRTKVLIASTLEDMLESIPLSRIRVTALCEKADINPQVFYYHFKDKYDVVAWIFLEDYEAAFESGSERPSSREELEDMMARQFENLWKRRKLYEKLLEDKSQNSLRDYIHERDVTVGTEAIKHSLGLQKLDFPTEYMVRFASHGGIGTTFEWLKGRIEASPSEMAKAQMELFPPQLVDAYLQKN